MDRPIDALVSGPWLRREAQQVDGTRNRKPRLSCFGIFAGNENPTHTQNEDYLIHKACFLFKDLPGTLNNQDPMENVT